MKLLDCDIYINDLEKAKKNIDLSVLKNQSILITGGLGLIGSAIVDLLLKSNVISCIYLLGRDNIKFANKYTGVNKIKFIPYDALKPLELNVMVDYVIYGAGLASPDLYVEKPVETMLSNIFGVQEMLEYCKKINVKKFLYISSSEVYGKLDTEKPFSEDVYGIIDIDDIRSSYAVAKRTSELLCRSYSKEYNLQTVIVRPGHIYGPSASILDKRISSDFIFKAASGKNLELKSAGFQKRSYCYSIDCAAAILIALMFGKDGDAYNIGHSESTTIREMANIVALAGNVKLSAAKPTEKELSTFNPMNNSALDSKKIQHLGYKETFSVKEGITHTVQILRKCEFADICSI